MRCLVRLCVWTSNSPSVFYGFMYMVQFMIFLLLYLRSLILTYICSRMFSKVRTRFGRRLSDISDHSNNLCHLNKKLSIYKYSGNAKVVSLFFEDRKFCQPAHPKIENYRQRNRNRKLPAFLWGTSAQNDNSWQFDGSMEK